MMSALIRPRSETFRPAALAQARTALRSAGEPPGRLAPRRPLLRGARRPASMKGASALFSLDRFFLPRSISQVTPSNPNETVSAFSEPQVVGDNHRHTLGHDTDRPGEAGDCQRAPCEMRHAATSRLPPVELFFRVP